jgi:hypothetical protein
VAVLYQSVGEEALTLGPFTPPVVTLIGLTKLDYGTMLLTAALPIAFVTLLVTWFMVQRIQRSTEEKMPAGVAVGKEIESFQPTDRIRNFWRSGGRVGNFE